MSGISCKSLALLLSAFSTACFIHSACPSESRAQQNVAGVDVFPANNIWNTKVNGLAVHASSDTYVNSIGRTTRFHPDWGSPQEYGIPYNIVQDGPKKPLKFYNVTFDYDD